MALDINDRFPNAKKIVGLFSKSANAPSTAHEAVLNLPSHNLSNHDELIKTMKKKSSIDNNRIFNFKADSGQELNNLSHFSQEETKSPAVAGRSKFWALNSRNNNSNASTPKETNYNNDSSYDGS